MAISCWSRGIVGERGKEYVADSFPYNQGLEHEIYFAEGTTDSVEGRMVVYKIGKFRTYSIADLSGLHGLWGRGKRTALMDH